MKLRVNGREREVETVDDGAESPLKAVLEQLGVGSRPVLVEHNGTALHTREWDEVTVREGDTLELVQIVAGG